MTEPHVQTRSSTAVVLEELQLYGWRPFTDEPDPRPLPEADAIRTAVADIFDALVSTLSDTRLVLCSGPMRAKKMIYPRAAAASAPNPAAAGSAQISVFPVAGARLMETTLPK